jgi:hypothetical protein
MNNKTIKIKKKKKAGGVTQSVGTEFKTHYLLLPPPKKKGSLGIFLCQCVSIGLSNRSLVPWCIAVIPALWRRKQEDQELESSLSYMVKPVSETKS